MPSVTLGNTPKGPIIQVQLSPSFPLQEAMRQANQPIPPPVTANFIVDTGATGTMADTRLVMRLGLNPINTIYMHTPSTGITPVACFQFDMSIQITGASPGTGWTIDSIPILAGTLASRGVEGLLGRDVLDLGILIYSGATGQFTLAY